MIDGNEGDCNVVDFCRLPLESGDYQAGSWRRVVIDTGPSGGIVPTVGQGITNTLVNVTTNLSFPKLDSETAWDLTPAINELQVRKLNACEPALVRGLKFVCRAVYLKSLTGNGGTDHTSRR